MATWLPAEDRATRSYTSASQCASARGEAGAYPASRGPCGPRSHQYGCMRLDHRRSEGTAANVHHHNGTIAHVLDPQRTAVPSVVAPVWTTGGPTLITLRTDGPHAPGWWPYCECGAGTDAMEAWPSAQGRQRSPRSCRCDPPSGPLNHAQHNRGQHGLAATRAARPVRSPQGGSHRHGECGSAPGEAGAAATCRAPRSLRSHGADLGCPALNHAPMVRIDTVNAARLQAMRERRSPPESRTATSREPCRLRWPGAYLGRPALYHAQMDAPAQRMWLGHR